MSDVTKLLERAIPLIEDEWEGTSNDTAGMEWLRDARAALQSLSDPCPHCGVIVSEGEHWVPCGGGWSCEVPA